MSNSSIRDFGELGVCLQKIVTRLMANDNLVKLLYYQDKDPLSQDDLTQYQKETEIFNKRILIIPKMPPQEQAQSTISIMATKGIQNGENNEIIDIVLEVEIFVPITQWIFKDSNLRPYSIMGEIKKSLDGKLINGIGRMKGGDFSLGFVSDEITNFVQTFRIMNYD